MVSNSAQLDRRSKQHTQFGVSASNGSRDMARTKSWGKKRKFFFLNNEANWMVSNSAQLDRRTKQHTQFGDSASNGSRDMGRTKSWRKKKMNIDNPIKHPLRGSLISLLGQPRINLSQKLANTVLAQPTVSIFLEGDLVGNFSDKRGIIYRA